MTRKLRVKFIVVIIVLGGSLFFLYPTFRLAFMDAEQRKSREIESPEDFDRLMKKSIKLGLDLKGGMHLVLEIDDSKLKAEERGDALDRALEVIGNRVDQFGVSDPTIQREGSKRVIVQLPGLHDAERAKRLIGQTALLEWRLVRQQEEVAGILRNLDRVFREAQGDSFVEIMPGGEEPEVGAVPDTAAAGEPEIGSVPMIPPPDTTDVGDSLLLALAGEERFNVPLQTIDKDTPFTSLLRSFTRDWLFVEEGNIPHVQRLLARSEAQMVFPKDSEFMWYDGWQQLQGGTRGKFLLLVARDIAVTGADLVDASPGPNPQAPNQLLVNFRFNPRGARLLRRFTGDNVGRFTAIILDGKIKSYPVIRSRIPDGRGIIEGSFTDEEARDLAIVLRAGALPAPLFIREERTVGPSLGSDSIRMGVQAAIFGLAIVLLFMLVYYKLSGGIAAIALIMNLVILLGMLAYLGAALTLPGIAGIILTIGMAIDANVLIFERIREELRKEKTIRSAIDAGYDRAFTTILDANMTTLITAVVLWQFGTGPIKGFATTLSIGIIASMFTALVFSRLIFQLWTRSGRVKRLSI